MLISESDIEYQNSKKSERIAGKNSIVQLENTFAICISIRIINFSELENIEFGIEIVNLNLMEIERKIPVFPWWLSEK